MKAIYEFFRDTTHTHSLKTADSEPIKHRSDQTNIIFLLRLCLHGVAFYLSCFFSVLLLVLGSSLFFHNLGFKLFVVISPAGVSWSKWNDFQQEERRGRGVVETSGENQWKQNFFSQEDDGWGWMVKGGKKGTWNKGGLNAWHGMAWHGVAHACACA